jgi:hypothetical protein
MGGFLRNFLVRRSDPERLKAAITTWLERKGFDPVARPPLFPCEKDYERGLFLVSNPDWTAVIYNKSIDEGDRLLQHLHEEACILEVWIHDSDFWGYELYERGDLTVAFNSNPTYFGQNDQKLPVNGDPDRICRLLELVGREARIARMQKRRAIFSEELLIEFCEIIDAPAGGLYFDVVEDWNEGRLETRTAAGWKIEPLFFERRRPLNEEPRSLELHSRAVRSWERQPSRHGQAISLNPEFQARLRAIGFMFKVLTFPLKLLFWPLRWCFHFKMRRLQKQAEKGVPLLGINALYQAMTESDSDFIRSGEWLVNRRHDCRIRVAPAESPAKSELSMRVTAGVLGFRVDGRDVRCQAVRREDLHTYFDLRPEATLVADEPFFTGPHPARLLAIRWKTQSTDRIVYNWLIELVDVIYNFSTGSEKELPPETLAHIKGVIQTFEAGPRQTPEAA